MVSQPSGHASLIGSNFGGYEVQALIGRGATGAVYLARDIALGRPIALKVLLGSLARTPSMVRSFYREAQAAAPLRHPCIVRVYSAGIESGTPYIAMEYVPGEPLDRFLRRKGQVSWQATLYVGAQVADALYCAHEAGIIHRDVKPANILLDRQGRVRLADFGIARVKTVDQSGEQTIIGTPQYMSPEQCAGGEITTRTDLYSLGVTMYQMIAGAMPFQGESPQALMRRIASDTPVRLNRILPEVPDDVARLVAHLLEKDPNNRPPDALQVCQTIERLQIEEGGRSAIPRALAAFVREQAKEPQVKTNTPIPKDKPKSKPEFVAVPVLNRRLLTAAAGVVLTLAVLTGASMWYALRDTRTVAPAPELDNCTFTPQADGTCIAELPTPAFSAQRLAWAGENGALLVEAAGRQSTLMQGGAGVLAIDPVSRKCLSVATPRGSATADGMDAAEPAPLALSSGLRMAKATPGILVGQRGVLSEQKAMNLLYVQRWNEAVPAINPAASLDSESRIPSIGDNDFTRCAHAVLRPDGAAICMIVQMADGTDYLAEQRLGTTTSATTVTGPGAPIVPDSLQYSPNGERLLFRRHGQLGKEELWSAPATGATPTLLAVGYFAGEAAISADGARIAAAWSNSAGEPAELQIIDATAGTKLMRLGAATVGHDAWMPTGDSLVIAAKQANGMSQLWLADAKDAQRRSVLTSLPQGVGALTAVSADGKWAAGIAAGERGVRVIFVDLSNRTNVKTAGHSGDAESNRV